jgi:hypothetical protein
MMPTPYERIDVIEQALKVLIARVEVLEKRHQQTDVYGVADKAVPGTTLHLPPKARQ